MPFPIPNILLQSYEEDMKQFLSGSTNNNKFFGDICRPSVKIQNGLMHFHSHHPRKQTTGNSFDAYITCSLQQ